MTGYWGAHYPKSTLGDVTFPNLRQLTLWNYVFCYSNQFEWVLQHKKLDSLSLIGCPIAVHLEIDHPGDCPNCSNCLFDSGSFDGTVTETDIGIFIWRNNLRWAQWLKKFQTDLNLKEFRMCGGHRHELSGDEPLEEFESCIWNEESAYNDLIELDETCCEDEVDWDVLENDEMRSLTQPDNMPLVSPVDAATCITYWW